VGAHEKVKREGYSHNEKKLRKKERKKEAGREDTSHHMYSDITDISLSIH
jgi:hypothetical protein